MNLTLPQEDTQQEKEEMTFLTKGYIFEVLTAVKLSLKEVWEDIRREKYKNNNVTQSFDHHYDIS